LPNKSLPDRLLFLLTDFCGIPLFCQDGIENLLKVHEMNTKKIKEKSIGSEGGVEAVDRSMKILSAYTRKDAVLNLHQLADRTGFYNSTLLRLLASLEKAGMIVRRPDKAFILGPEVMRLAAVYQHNFRLADYVRPVLKHIVETTGESSSFFGTQGDHRICLVRENSPRSIRDHAVEGDILPLSRGAAGRVLTNFRDVRGDKISRDLLQALPYVSYGEVDQEMAGVAAPVFSSDYTLAGALAVSGPTHRFTSRAVSKYKPLILEAAQRLSETLGANTNVASLKAVKSATRRK